MQLETLTKIAGEVLDIQPTLDARSVIEGILAGYEHAKQEGKDAANS